MLPPPSPHTQKTNKGNNNNNKTSKTKQNDNSKSKQNKINKWIKKQTNKQTENKSSTVVPKLVTLDCSLTHVLQTPNTQPYHSDSWLTGVICEVVKPQRPDQDWEAPLQCFSWKLGSCRGVNSWRWVSKFNLPTWTGIMCEVVTPKDNVKKNKTHLHLFKNA